ncbi:MAG: 23S rRNA (pseudouridine(1915)-N(3))-methyltransferase RlmH [Burkholderiales bacterium]|nr:23S rRNA (pseudouridine(1915)-N(3))-methyltransferase RlmH [Burkholderiales bacterium]
MKLHILAVGNKMPDWITSAFGEYEKRMPREARMELREIRPERRDSGKSVQQIQEIEASRVNAAMPHNAFRVILDEKGDQLSTMEFAGCVVRWMQEGRDAAFVIGGADGTHPDLREKADRVISLSKMTLPHGLARVMLAEQIYRAVSIINHHPYHRDG